MLSRLVIKDILVNLGPGVEPESRQALEALLGQPSVVVPLPMNPPPFISGTQIVNNQPLIAARVIGPDYLTAEDIRVRELTPDEVNAINGERKTNWEASQRLAQGIPYGQATRPEIPQGAGIERVALGAKNSLGEVCIQIDPESACSLFQCAHGHAYWGNNPSIRGCTQCHLEGNAVTAVIEREDPNAIEGEDSRW